MLRFSTCEGDLFVVKNIQELIYVRTNLTIKNLEFDINFVERVTVKVTPDIINDMCDMLHYSGERKLNQEHVAYLRDALVNGRFYWPQWDVAYCCETNEIVRMNGMHSCKMMRGVMQDGLFDALLSKYYASVGIHIVKTRKDLALLFDSFDSPMSARTLAEAINARLEAEDMLNAAGITFKPGSVEKMLAGIVAFLQLTDRKFAVKSKKKRQEYVSAFISFIAHYWQYTRRQKPRRFDLAGIVAGMFATYTYMPTEAEIFWAEVLKDIGEPADIHRQLSSYLGSSVLQTKQHKQLTVTETQFQQVTVAFDTFVRGKTIKNLSQVIRIPNWVYAMELRYG